MNEDRKRDFEPFVFWRITQDSIDENLPFANQAMDKWEQENLPPEKRGQSRLLYCPCPRCNPITC